MASYFDHISSPEARRRLSCFEADLLRWGRAQNLVSRARPEVEVGRLLLECVLVGRWLEARLPRLEGRWVDVGSGAGFPGIVLASLFPSQALDLVERRQGRCDFLRRELRALSLDCAHVLEIDAGDLVESPYSLVCLKAVAPPPEALALAAGILAPDGLVLLFQRPSWRPPEGWGLVDSWVGSAGEVDLSSQAAHLLQRLL